MNQQIYTTTEAMTAAGSGTKPSKLTNLYHHRSHGSREEWYKNKYPNKSIPTNIKNRKESMKEVINKLRERRVFLIKVLKQIEDRENIYPEGTLRIRVKNDRGIYYHILDKTDTCGVYIPRKDDDLAKKLAQKEYEKKYKKSAMKELKSIERFLKDNDHANLQSCIECFSNLNPVRKELIAPFEISDVEYAAKWKEVSYEGLPFRDNDMSNYITDAGERVRSKSELLIANLLYKKNIPYKYECPLKIGNHTIYPDFTVLNARKRKVLYWEHFGMMGDIEYCNNALKKILAYSSEDFLVGDKLITTFETVNTSLDIKYINKVIKFYLL